MFTWGNIWLVAGSSCIYALLCLSQPYPGYALLPPHAVPVQVDQSQPAAEQAQVLALAHFISAEWDVPVPRALDVVQKAFSAGSTQSVDPVLILAIMAQESSFVHEGNAHAWLRGGDEVNPMHPHGLMQVSGRWHLEKMPRDAQGEVRSTTSEENIRIGAQILHEYLVRERGDLPAALQRYNGNLGDKTKRYANSVLGKLRDLGAVAPNV